MYINKFTYTQNSIDYNDSPNKIMELFKTDVFLTDRPSFIKEDIIEGSDRFHKQQMTLYSAYSDGSVL